MGVVARHTVFNYPITGPVGNTLAVGTANPVFMLPEMALPAHLVTVIHIDLYFCFGHQEITFVLFVTGIARHLLYLAAVFQENFTMGHFSGLWNAYGLVFMALTAFKPLYLVFAGLRPEKSPLVSPGHLNDVSRKHGYDTYFRGLIVRSVCIFIGLRNAALITVCDPYGKDCKGYKNDGEEAFFAHWYFHNLSDKLGFGFALKRFRIRVRYMTLSAIAPRGMLGPDDIHRGRSHMAGNAIASHLKFMRNRWRRSG